MKKIIIFIAGFSALLLLGYDFVPLFHLGRYRELGMEHFKIVKNPAVKYDVKKYGNCVKCHRGIEVIDKNHNFSCVKCHGGNPESSNFKEAHRNLIPDPGAPDNWKRCAVCHQRDIENLRTSPHYTFAGVINSTLYQLTGKRENYSALPSPHFRKLPEPESYPEDMTALAISLIRGKCAICHISSKPPDVDGFMRGKGCSACHIIYANDGVYRGGDKSLKGKRGYPLYHQFSDRIPSATCMHCHHGHFVGGEYSGLYPRDYHLRYRADLAHQKSIEGIYGMDYLHLVPDIHFHKGLHCTDCHTRNEIMGNGRSVKWKREAVKVSCMSCHGGGEFWHRGMFKRGGKYFFKSHVTGKIFPLKLYSRKLLYHRIPGHEKLSCVACHSAWGEQDYGWNLVREDVPDWEYWKDYFVQGDPWVLKQFFFLYMRDKGFNFPPPATMGVDWITGRKLPGVWFNGYMMRRWENPPLGYDERKGKFYPARPEFQFYISYGDMVTGKMLSNYFAVYSPHTVTLRGRSCESCHQNPKTAGMGVRRYRVNGGLTSWDLYPLFELKGFYKDGERGLGKKEKRILLYPDKSYKYWRWKVYKLEENR